MQPEGSTVSELVDGRRITQFGIDQRVYWKLKEEQKSEIVDQWLVRPVCKFRSKLRTRRRWRAYVG